MTQPVLQNTVALITGAGLGVGAATAHLFAAAGARVAVTDVNIETGEQTAAEIKRAGGHAVFIPADVSQSDQVQAMVQTVVSTFGRLDVAVNNAAVTPDTAPLVDLDAEQWDYLMGVNLKGVALCLKYELRQLQDQGEGGSIVNVSSVRGFRGKANAAAYVAAKHGVVGLTKVAAMEHGEDNIRVNSVAPGATDTPMLRASRATRGEADYNPSPSLLNRFGAPEEVAQASLWLASSLSSYVTASTIHADGGYMAT